MFLKEEIIQNLLDLNNHLLMKKSLSAWLILKEEETKKAKCQNAFINKIKWDKYINL